MSELKIDNKLVTAISIGGKNVQEINIGGKLFSFVKPDVSYLPVSIRPPAQCWDDTFLTDGLEIYKEIRGASIAIWFFGHDGPREKWLPITSSSPATHKLRFSGKITYGIQTITEVDFPDIPLYNGAIVNVPGSGVSIKLEVDPGETLYTDYKITIFIDESLSTFPKTVGLVCEGVVPI